MDSIDVHNPSQSSEATYRRPTRSAGAVARGYLGSKYYYLLLLPLALLMFPNRGIIHDTRLYVFDILNIVDANIFANDLLATAGTQNQYTLYAYIVAPLYKILSPWAATTLIFIAGQLIWFSGLAALVVKIAGDEKTTFYGLLSAFLLPTAYFGFSVLSYGENFATPRLFVEGLTFWSLWSFFSRAYLMSALLVLAALSLHPIMGLIAAALIVAVLLLEARRWWWIFGAGSLAGMALVLVSGIVPLERLTAALEGDWLHVVQTRAKYLYVSEWPVKDWARILLATSIAIPLAALYSGWQRRLILAALIVAAAGLLVSFIGTDLLHNVLLSQVQTSRTVWFVFLLGNVGLGVVVASLYKKSEADGDALLFLYLLAWIVTHLLWPLPGLALGLVASGLAYLRITGKIAGIPSLLRRLIYLTSMILIFWMFYFRIRFWLDADNHGAIFQQGDSYVGITGFSQMEVVFIAFAIFGVVRLRLNVPALLIKGLLILLMAWSVFVWDRRSADNRGLDGDYIVDTLVEQIPEGAQVYWEGNAKGAWFLLRRPGYFASIQGAGGVFSEPLAVEFWRRSRVVNSLDGVDYVDIWQPYKNRKEQEAHLEVRTGLTRNDLVSACTGAPNLDYLVLTRQVTGAYLTVWHPQTHDQVADATPAKSGSPQVSSRYLYRCADFR